MGVDKKQRQLARQITDTGVHLVTEELTAAGSEIIRFGTAVAKVTYQSTGTLVGTIEFSVNGSNFFGSDAFAATVPESHSTHNVTAVRITWTSGAGRLAIAAK